MRDSPYWEAAGEETHLGADEQADQLGSVEQRLGEGGGGAQGAARKALV